MSKWRSVSDFLCKWKQPAASCSPQITSQGQTARCCLVYSRCFRSAVLASILSNACQPNVLQSMLLIPSLTIVHIPRSDLFDLVFSTHTNSLTWECWMKSKWWFLHVWPVRIFFSGFYLIILEEQILQDNNCVFTTEKQFSTAAHLLFYIHFKGTTLQCKT